MNRDHKDYSERRSKNVNIRKYNKLSRSRSISSPRDKRKDNKHHHSRRENRRNSRSSSKDDRRNRH